jgi:hypothetical protein
MVQHPACGTVRSVSVPVIIRRARWVVGAAVAVGLFFAYLLMSRAVGVNSDGASNALQAWDMLDGNVLLRGWTVTDVSFYTNELLLFALVEATYGFHGDTTSRCWSSSWRPPRRAAPPAARPSSGWPWPWRSWRCRRSASPP